MRTSIGKELRRSPRITTLAAGAAGVVVVADLLLWPVAFLVIKSVSRTVFSIPKEVLAAAIALLCLLGAYADGANGFNIWVALVAGLVAYLMKLGSIPLGPAILGLVLGAQMESALSNSLSVSGGSWLIFVDVRISTT